MAKAKRGQRQEMPKHLQGTEMVMVIDEKGHSRMVRRKVEPKK